MGNGRRRMTVSGKDRKDGRRRHIALPICLIAIATITGIFISVLLLGNGNDAPSNEDTRVNASNGNGNATNAINENGDNVDASNGNAAHGVSKDAATNTERTVTKQIPSDGGTSDVSVSGTTDDDAIDDRMVSVIGLLASCAGNDAAPDATAGDDAGMAPTSYYQQFASKPFEQYTPEDMPLNSQNLIELYRMSDHASTVYPTLSHREVTKIDIIGDDGTDDDMHYYAARVSSKDTMKTGFGSGTKDTVSMVRIGFVNGQAITAYESEL